LYENTSHYKKNLADSIIDVHRSLWKAPVILVRF